MNQMFGGLDPYGMAGHLVADTLNTSNYTYEMAAVFVLMEKYVMEMLYKMIGWNVADGDGIMTPGGSMANMYGIECAVHRMNPETKV